MKILQVNCVYKDGSTGKITRDLHQELIELGIDSVVCYGRGNIYSEKKVYKITSELYSHINHLIANISGILYGGCYLSTKKLERIIEKEKPDIVHLQCINGFFINIYRVIEWLKNNNIKTVLTLHAEFMYTGGCGHSINCNQWKSYEGCGHPNCPQLKSQIKAYFFDRTATMWHRMKKAFDGYDHNLAVVSVSPWLQSRAESSVILYGKNHSTILNGVDTNIFYFRYDLTIKKNLGIKGEKIIFYVTPYFSINPNDIKGGYHIFQLADRLKKDNAYILVAGTYDKRVNIPQNMIMLGKITDQNELAEYYSLANVTVLTSKRETFSMVTAESLCCGTPVIGFKAGGPEYIAIPEYSEFVEHSNVELLYNTILKWISNPVDKVAISEKAREKYSKETMCKNYIKIYNELIHS